MKEQPISALDPLINEEMLYPTMTSGICYQQQPKLKDSHVESQIKQLLGMFYNHTHFEDDKSQI